MTNNNALNTTTNLNVLLDKEICVMGHACWSEVRATVMACVMSNGKVAFRSRKDGRFVSVRPIYRAHLIQDLICDLITSDNNQEDTMTDTYDLTTTSTEGDMITSDDLDYTSKKEAFSTQRGLFSYNITEEDKEYTFVNPYTDEIMTTMDKLQLLQWKEAYNLSHEEEKLQTSLANGGYHSKAASRDDVWYNRVSNLEAIMEEETIKVYPSGYTLYTPRGIRAMKKHFGLVAQSNSKSQNPWSSGDMWGSEPGMAEEAPISLVKEAHFSEQALLDPQHVDVENYHNWKPMWESRERNLKHVLRMLNLKLGRTTSWEEVHALISWAKDCNRAESYMMNGKVQYVAQSNAMGYLGTQAITLFVYGWFGMRKAKLNLTNEECVCIATMWADKNTGMVARDYKNKSVPAANRFVTREQIMEVNEQSREVWTTKYMVWVKEVLNEKY